MLRKGGEKMAASLGQDTRRAQASSMCPGKADSSQTLFFSPNRPAFLCVTSTTHPTVHLHSGLVVAAAGSARVPRLQALQESKLLHPPPSGPLPAADRSLVGPVFFSQSKSSATAALSSPITTGHWTCRSSRNPDPTLLLRVACLPEKEKVFSHQETSARRQHVHPPSGPSASATAVRTPAARRRTKLSSPPPPSTSRSLKPCPSRSSPSTHRRAPSRRHDVR